MNALVVFKKLLKRNAQYISEAVQYRKAILSEESIVFEDFDRIIEEEYRPCFVLSTGRCGTAFLTRIIDTTGSAFVNHNEIPELVVPSVRAYQRETAQTEFAIMAARYDLIERAYILGKIYVETNRRITFFAPALSRVFKNSVFIHLVRDPISFVKSGVTRGYYQDARVSRGLISPQLKNEWIGYTQHERIAWLWQETNQFVEIFKNSIEPARSITIRSEDLFNSTDCSRRAIEFCGCKPISDKKLESLGKRPVNVNSKRASGLSDDQVKRITQITKLSANYNYNF